MFVCRGCPRVLTYLLTQQPLTTVPHAMFADLFAASTAAAAAAPPTASVEPPPPKRLKAAPPEIRWPAPARPPPPPAPSGWRTCHIGDMCHDKVYI